MENQNPKSETKTVEVKKPDLKIVTTQFKHSFTDAETKQLAIQAAQHNSEYASLELQVSSIKKDYAGRMESEENERNRAFSKITDGFEMRPTEAVVEFIPIQKKKRFYFVDETLPDKKGEFIREETMSPSDFERELVFEKKPDSEPAKPAMPVHNESAKQQIANEAQALE